MVTKDVFNLWLSDPDMLAMLEDVEIDTSAKFDLFDVLDSDLSGELSFDETVEGLMILRGPGTKSDIVAIRLMLRCLRSTMEDVLSRLDEQAARKPRDTEPGRRVS